MKTETALDSNRVFILNLAALLGLMCAWWVVVWGGASLVKAFHSSTKFAGFIIVF